MSDADYFACERRRVFRLGLFALAIFAAIHVSGISEGLLYLAPTLLLAGLLLAGHYPGERLIARLAGHRRERRRARGGRPRLHRRPPRKAPCGGLLIALSLAGRGPPPGS